MADHARDDGGHRTGSGPRPRATARFSLRLGGHDLPLTDGRYTLGRSPTCDFRIDSTHVSRQHASLEVHGDVITVRDLGSRNGVFVGSRRVRDGLDITESATLNVGGAVVDVIRLGDQVAPARARSAITVEIKPLDDDEEPVESTLNADGFTLLTGVVDKMFVLGRADEAERVLAGHLSTLLEEAKASVPLRSESCETAGRYAARLAASTRRGEWVSYAFQLYFHARLVMPTTLVDDLLHAVQRSRGVDRKRIREYVEYLDARSAGLSPSERFALQRITSLERLAAAL